MKIPSIAAISGVLAIAVPIFATAQPAAVPSAAQNPAVKSPNDITQAALAKGHNSFTKGEARTRIEKAGYSDVKNLTLDPDGLWQASAEQNGQSVRVALDYKGNVASQ
jgi:hypothetical protein